MIATGDIITLGRQRLMCGDCRNPSHVAKLLGSVRPSLLFTSPPYMGQRDYHGKIDDWTSLMVQATLAPKMAEDAQLFVNLGPCHKDSEWVPYWEPWLQAVRKHGWRRFQMCIWNKVQGSPGAFNGRLSPSFEFVFHLNKMVTLPNKTVRCSTSKPRGMPKMRGKDGKPLVRSHMAQRRGALPYKIPSDVFDVYRATGNPIDHPAVMPTGLPEQVLNAYARPNQAVYEPFAGSGTTLAAAHALGLMGFGMELSPTYCEVAAERLAKAMA